MSRTFKQQEENVRKNLEEERLRKLRIGMDTRERVVLYNPLQSSQGSEQISEYLNALPDLSDDEVFA